MPWERKTVDNQRSEFVARATMGEESLSALCRKYGISRPTGYKWLERYKGGETMLDRPHTPFRKPFKTSPDVELRIVDVRAAHPTWGARKIQRFLADGIIGQMMEKVVLPPYQPRRTEEEIIAQCPWAVQGKKGGRKGNVITSLELDPAKMEENNIRFQAKYRKIEENEVRYEEFQCEDADYLLIAFGSSARICQKVVEIARAEGIKLGLLRPITLWPFPTKVIAAYADKVKGMLSVELNAGQMVEDVRLAVNGKVKVEHFGRLGGIVFTPDEVLNALKEKLF